MSLEVFTFWGAAAVSAALALVVSWRRSRTAASTSFAAGLALLALRSAALGIAASAPADSIVFWKHAALLPGSLLPGCWMIFALTYARSDPQTALREWRPAVAAAFVLPVLLATLFGGSLFLPASGFVVPLGWAGQLLQLVVLVTAVAILANLESTLRGSRGGKRWRIKFVLIGAGCIFAVEVYVAAQALLYSGADLLLDPLRSYALLVAGVLFVIGLVRTWDTPVEVQLSRSLVFNSISVILVGGYLLAVGIIAEAITLLGGAELVPLVTLVVFVLLLALALVALSDRLRERIRSFVTHNLYAPGYDYRKEWTTYARRSASIVDPQELCRAVAHLVSETFGVDSVSVWRCDEHAGKATFGGSTALSPAQLRESPALPAEADVLVEHVAGRGEIVDFHDVTDGDSADVARRCAELFERARIRWATPLMAAQRVVGVMTLGERITKAPFGIEDFDLLRTISDQTAASLLNLELSEQIATAKEMEAFQTLSTFFVHDLKNLASMLSLTVQNLPKNYDNPEFREDALRVISDSVRKMNAMCTRLSLLNRKLELERRDTDLNEIVRETLDQVRGSVRATLHEDLRPVPPVPIDREQIGKVLTNLLLNANDAVESGGEISIETSARDGWVFCTVSDTGCGMPPEFVEQSLFRPFRTTKAKGLGIGLFQSKQLVEAHGGRMEVDSTEGRGTRFCVLLPNETSGR